jgi:hypothetical protein
LLPPRLLAAIETTVLLQPKIKQEVNAFDHGLNCPVLILVCIYLENFPKMMNGFVQIERLFVNRLPSYLNSKTF